MHTLGCKVNRYETEYIRSALIHYGCVECHETDVADLVIVNTCTVTAESDAKSRKIIRKLVKENPGAEVVVIGCSVQHQPESILEIAGVTKIIPDKEQIPVFLQQLVQQRGWNTDNILPTGIERFGERHRAFVKVQDGCVIGCSYCIIPKVRPVLSSRPVGEVLDEIRVLSKNGYREIVLTGIHLGHYGRSTNVENRTTDNLAALVKRVAELDEPLRIRLSSLEAVEVTDELIDLMTAYPDRICPHLHLSMQSGSDTVLKRMKRRWSRSRFIERCNEIAARFDKPALTTDVIVGFPGETDNDFEATCDAVKQLRFSKVHVFRFSPREGTEAATFTDVIPQRIQKERATLLAQTAEKLRQEYAASLVGIKETVLMETPYTGTASRYIDVRLAQKQTTGELVAVTLTDAHQESCRGETVNLRQSPDR
ncbi:tRNA (N(6)-L-threonylcarbamoyladenosine(37)-C(2))-methylthiotransferase MtaB [Planctomycetales bacterium]|nr:tRNA (N(6)-L-threonylcarbamoyladenosine(37)-C(2))-methylthiotransferase MtaB [Planctomycetales bacterium]